MEVPRHWRLKQQREGFRGGECQHCGRVSLQDKGNHGGFCECGVANIHSDKGEWTMSMLNRDYYNEVKARASESRKTQAEIVEETIEDVQQYVRGLSIKNTK